MEMTIQTNGKVFSILSVAKIPGTKKDFHAITFTSHGRQMVIGHSKTAGAKFFWFVDGRGTKELSKSEFWKWIKRYDGKDARKLAGYAKIMQPVALGPVIGLCVNCDRGLDQRTMDYSLRQHGHGLCKNCQVQDRVAEQLAATKGSGRDTLFGVPMFTWEELVEMKVFKLEALLKQIEKAMEKAQPDNQGLGLCYDYIEEIQRALPSHYEEPAYCTQCGGDAVICSPVCVHDPDKTIERSDDQREEQLGTDGVKEGSEGVSTYTPVTAGDTLSSYRGHPNWGLCLQMKLKEMKKQAIWDLKESLGVISTKPYAKVTVANMIEGLLAFSPNHRDALEVFFAPKMPF